MRTPVDARLLDEASRFALRFACDDCAHFGSPANGTEPACGHGYPLEPRRRALVSGSSVLFCKEFELGAPPDPSAGDDVGDPRLAGD